MPANMPVKLTATRFACWKCGSALWKLEPEVDGWKYHCQKCQMLTSPSHEIAAARDALPPDAAGILAGIPCRIEMEPA